MSRRLDLPGGKVWIYSHSALILEMADGMCLLEYMNDGKAHLSNIPPVSEWESCRSKVCTSLKDYKGNSYEWSRQSTGKELRIPVTPQEAKKKMQNIMGPKYGWIRNNCHKAQRKLREEWNIFDSQPTTDEYPLKPFCQYKWFRKLDASLWCSGR